MQFLTEQTARRPAAPVAALLLSGIGLHGFVPALPWMWVGVTSILIAIAVLQRRNPTSARWALAGAIVAVGIAAAQVAHFRYPGRDISTYATEEPRLAEIEIRLLHPPRLLTTPLESGRPLPPKQITSGEVIRLRTWSGWTDGSGRLLVQILEPHPELQVGQSVRVLGMLERPAPAMNPGQFDWASYYREQRILTSVRIPQADNITILDTPARGPVTWLRELVRRLLATGFRADQWLDHALLRALLLGDSDPELRDVQDDFRRTGTSHHLSISGMHVAILGGFVFLLCRLVLMPPRWAVIVMMGFVVLYGLVALPSPPVVRSVLLCLALGIGRIGRRSIDPIQLLSLSVVLMLVYHPLDAFNAGFQLSFGTVLGLMIFTGPLTTFLAGEPDPDMVALARAGRLSRWRRVGLHIDRSLVQAVAAGLVAWTVSLPLIATHFEQMNPWAVLAGLILAPLVLAALVAGLLKIVLTLLWPGLAGAWAAFAAAPIATTRHLVDWLAQIPGSDVPLPAPPWWMIVLLYGLLLLTLVKVPSPSVRWSKRVGPVAACAAVLLLPFHTTLVRATRGDDELRLTFLHVGAGQCAVLEPPSGRVMLLDAGSSSLNDLLYKCLGPYLRHRGITEIDSAIVTHTNYDHYSAIADAARAYGVREVMTSAHFVSHASGNPSAESMLRALDRLNRPPRVVTPGQSIPLGRDSVIEVLWPPDSAETLEANDASLVFRIVHGQRAILVTGDIQEAGLRELLKDPAKLKADVLIAPHHGSSEPSTPAFLAAVDPDVIISSNDRTLTHRQRTFNELAGDRVLLRTHECGAITITLGADGAIDVQTHLSPRSRDQTTKE